MSCYGESFTAGAFLSFAFFRMIPHYLRNSDYEYDVRTVLFIATLCLFYLFAVASKRRKSDAPNAVSFVESMPDIDASQASMRAVLIPYFEDNGLMSPKIVQFVMLALMLTNSAMLGVSLGITNQGLVTVPLFSAIAVQKLFEMIAIGIQLAKLNFSSLTIWLFSLTYSLVTPVVVIFSSLYLCCQDLALITTLNAISAGIFLLIGCSQWYRIFVCPYEYRKMEIVRISVMFVLGIALMSIILIGGTEN